MANLHPTLRLCGCGFIGDKKEFYDHLDIEGKKARFFRTPGREFWLVHGERILLENDPRVEKHFMEGSE